MKVTIEIPEGLDLTNQLTLTVSETKKVDFWADLYQAFDDKIDSIVFEALEKLDKLKEKQKISYAEAKVENRKRLHDLASYTIAMASIAQAQSDGLSGCRGYYGHTSYLNQLSPMGQAAFVSQYFGYNFRPW